MERAERQPGGGSGMSGRGWLRRALGLLAMSRRERPWRSEIDFQKMTRDLVEAAKERGVIEDDPQTVEQVVAMLAGCMKDIANIYDIHDERLERVEKDLGLLRCLVLGLWSIALLFVGVVLVA